MPGVTQPQRAAGALPASQGMAGAGWAGVWGFPDQRLACPPPHPCSLQVLPDPTLCAPWPGSHTGRAQHISHVLCSQLCFSNLPSRAWRWAFARTLPITPCSPVSAPSNPRSQLSCCLLPEARPDCCVPTSSVHFPQNTHHHLTSSPTVCVPSSEMGHHNRDHVCRAHCCSVRTQPRAWPTAGAS